MSQLQEVGACDLGVGLTNARPAESKVKHALLELLDAQGEDVTVALEARFSEFGVCKRGDIVLLKHDGYRAGKLLMLAEVSGVCIAMVEVWTLRSSDLPNMFSKWSPKDASKILAPLENILDTVTHTALNGGKVVTVLHPPDLR